MGMYMFVSQEDRVTKRKVSDAALNEIFQEALSHDPSLMIEEYDKYQKQIIFRKPRLQKVYNVFHESPAHDGSAYQARYQMCACGDKEIVVAYLYGIINGANHSREYALANESVIQVAQRIYREENPVSRMDTPTFVYEQVEKANKRRFEAKSDLNLYEWCKQELSKSK